MGAATPAATVVCVRPGAAGPEILMLRRRADGAFGGMWVFPGGRVDAGDATGAGAAGAVAAAQKAAAREAFEEAGIVLDPESLVPLSYWVPPAETARRFATWFFVTAAPRSGRDAVVLCAGEIDEHRWARPVDVLAAQRSGDASLAPPTWMTLWSLTRYGSVDEVLAAASSRLPERYLTRVVLSPSGHLAATLWEGDCAYGDRDVDLDRPGPRRRLVQTAQGWQPSVDVDGPPADTASRSSPRPPASG